MDSRTDIIELEAEELNDDQLRQMEIQRGWQGQRTININPKPKYTWEEVEEMMEEESREQVGKSDHYFDAISMTIIDHINLIKK